MAEAAADARTATELERWRSRMAEEIEWADDAGYFGPTSTMWQIHQEAVLGIGLGRAVLMEIAHPWVAQAIADHSSIESHPDRRLLETAGAAEILIFGSRAQADRTAARIRTVHSHIRGVLREDVGQWKRGTLYRADDPDALLWVLATLVDTVLAVHTSCFGRLPRSIEASYLRDCAQLGAMLGIPRGMVWQDRSSLTRYIYERISDGTVHVGNLGSRLAAGFVELGRSEGTSGWWRVFSSGALAFALRTMPRELRTQFNLIMGVSEYATYRGLGMVGRGILGHLPAVLRVDPITRKALRQADAHRRVYWTESRDEPTSLSVATGASGANVPQEPRR